MRWPDHGEVSQGSGLEKLLGFLPGTSTVTAQFSTQLEYAVDLDFDAVSLDYAWGPAPDSKRCAQCAMTDSYEACMETFMRWCSLEVAWIRSQAPDCYSNSKLHMHEGLACLRNLGALEERQFNSRNHRAQR